MLAGTLITYAYYLSGLVSREFEDVTDTQTADGLLLFNDVLAEINVSGRYIPYYDYITVTGVPGQENYTLPNAVDILTATFNIGSVRYDLRQDQLLNYYGSARIDNVAALPYKWYWQRTKEGVQVSFYFQPESNYIFKFFCKVGLSEVTLDTELDDIYDKSYQLYLRYKVCEYICNWNNVTVSAEVQKKLKQFEQIYSDYNADDFTIKKVSSLSKITSLTFAQVNIGKGWTPP